MTAESVMTYFFFRDGDEQLGLFPFIADVMGPGGIVLYRYGSEVVFPGTRHTPYFVFLRGVDEETVRFPHVAF